MAFVDQTSICDRLTQKKIFKLVVTAMVTRPNSAMIATYNAASTKDIINGTDTVFPRRKSDWIALGEYEFFYRQQTQSAKNY